MTRTPTQEQSGVDIQTELSPEWFGVNHGCDNYEEAIKISEIVYIKAFNELSSEYSYWHIKLVLKS